MLLRPVYARPYLFALISRGRPVSLDSVLISARSWSRSRSRSRRRSSFIGSRSFGKSDRRAFMHCFSFSGSLGETLTEESSGVFSLVHCESLRSPHTVTANIVPTLLVDNWRSCCKITSQTILAKHKSILLVQDDARLSCPHVWSLRKYKR